MVKNSNLFFLISYKNCFVSFFPLSFCIVILFICRTVHDKRDFQSGIFLCGIFQKVFFCFCVCFLCRENIRRKDRNTALTLYKSFVICIFIFSAIYVLFKNANYTFRGIMAPFTIFLYFLQSSFGFTLSNKSTDNELETTSIEQTLRA